jgi:site-specific DNA recombinase
MKTCVYARKSTNKKGQKDTIENQIDICKHAAEQKELDVVDVKMDTGTGTDDLNRPEVRRLIDDAVEGKYNCVIMKGISRFYRDTEKGLGLIKMLDRNGIRVITVEETFDSSLPENRTGTGKLDLSRITMYLMFSEMESKKLADRIKHTQLLKARKGEWNQVSSIPYGFKYNPETKKLEINQSEAPVVRLIFDLYEKGTGMKSIAQYLNGDNENGEIYPSPKSKRWNEYTIGFMLKNRVYIGDIVYNKRSKKERSYKQPEMIGKSKSDIYIGADYNTEDKWVVVENAHDGIIEKETFDNVQAIIETKSKRKGIRNNISLFAGIAICEKCGSGMTFKRGNRNAQGVLKSKDNYYCMNYIRYGKKFCTSHHVGAKELEEEVINQLKGLYKDSKLLDKIIKKNENNLPNNTIKYVKEKTEVEKEIEKISSITDKLLVKNLEGDITDQQFKLMNEKYSKQLDILTDKLVELEKNINSSNKTDINIDRFKKRLKNIVEYDELSIEEKRYLLLDLINKILIIDTPDATEIQVMYSFEDPRA